MRPCPAIEWKGTVPGFLYVRGLQWKRDTAMVDTRVYRAFDRLWSPLQWRHNDHESVSNHQPRGCLLNRLFGRRSKKTPKLRVTGLCAGNSPGPVNSPHKGPVTRKMFPFDDVIMSKSRDRQPGDKCYWSNRLRLMKYIYGSTSYTYKVM